MWPFLGDSREFSSRSRTPRRDAQQSSRPSRRDEQAVAVGRPKVIEMNRTLGLGLGLLLSLSLSSAIAGCDNGNHMLTVPEAGVNDGGPPVDAGMEFQDTGIGFSTLSILRVVPDHGPFIGGNVAILRGAGFTADAQV